MATYTQGYQPYMPDWQPFTPDYKFLSDVLDVKTNRYNTNYKALNDVYTKVVYGDLSRSDTQEMRKQYAENLGKQLELISGMDLSLAQNVDAANQLFKPFFEEDIIVKDLTFTKQYQNEMQYANMLMNSPDAEQRKTYWQTGVKALDYQLEDFKNASPDVALTMGTPRYIGNANLYDKAINYLKESGLDVTQEYVDDTGFFIIKDRNGNLVTEQAYTMAQRALLNDPSVQQAYYADAYVRSRDFAKAGMEAGTFASVDQGQATWAKETISAFEQQLAARALKEQNKVDELKNININWDQYVKEQGIIPGSDEEKTYTQQRASYEAALQGLQITEQVLKDSQGNPDQSTQGLLNRAYNLLMGYNIQNDLSAAAISYSNMNRSRELKVNEYKKQELDFKYDMAKIAQRHENDKILEGIKQLNALELEDYKNKLENPFGSFLTGLFSQEGIDTKQGTEQVLIDPETGEAINPETADYVNLNNNKIEQIRQSVTAEQVDLAVRALEAYEKSNNNSYYVNDKIKGDLPTIREELLKPENAGVADSLFRNMAYVFRNKETAFGISSIFAKNPNFVKQNQGADYYNMLTEFNKVTAKRRQFDTLVTTNYDVMLKNFTTALSTDLTNDIKKVKSELSDGVPKVFRQNTLNGSVEFMTEDEFVNAYVQKAKQNGIAGENFMETYDKPANTRDGYYSPSIRVTKFSEDKAIKFAKEAYATQKKIINNTFNGSLETIAEQEGKKPNAQVRMFQPWDPDQFMRGVGMEKMNAGDALKSPYYSTQINPTSLTRDREQVSAVAQVITQVNRTTPQELIFHQGDIGTKDPDDVNMNSSDATAQRLYKLWVQDLSRFTDPKASKENVPNATIGYAPSYGPTGKETLGKDKAAYVLSFSPDWLKSLETKGVISKDDLSSYSDITISFPQSKDINPRKAGEYNFSALRNEVMFSPQKQYVQSVDAGGDLRVYQNGRSEFIMEVNPLEYNSATGNFDPISSQTINLTQIQTERNEPISFLDNIYNEALQKLTIIGQQNNRDQSSNKKTKVKN